MAAERSDGAKGGEADKGSAAGQASGADVKGGIKQWLPLIINVALMPLLAYVMTTFVLLPRLNTDSHPAGPDGKSAKPESPSAHGESVAGGVGKGKFTAPLSGKILVNVAGTMGTRYLLANVTLVSPQAGLKDAVERNDAELRDVAAGVLATKTIADLEKPGARNLIRSELISVFNNVLGDGIVSELYLTEFAIQ
jgi:flagellar FliL protein